MCLRYGGRFSPRISGQAVTEPVIGHRLPARSESPVAGFGQSVRTVCLDQLSSHQIVGFDAVFQLGELRGVVAVIDGHRIPGADEPVVFEASHSRHGDLPVKQSRIRLGRVLLRASEARGSRSSSRPTPARSDLGTAHRARRHRDLPDDETEPALLVGADRPAGRSLGWRWRWRWRWRHGSWPAGTGGSGRCSRPRRRRTGRPDLVGDPTRRACVTTRPRDLEPCPASTATCPHTGSCSLTRSPRAPIPARYPASPARTAAMSAVEYSWPCLAS